MFDMICACALEENSYPMQFFGEGHCICSASSKISKGQGYLGFLRKRAGSSFGQKGQFASYKYKEKLEKWTISLLLG
jgi:hypothetical protein